MDVYGRFRASERPRAAAVDIVQDSENFNGYVQGRQRTAEPLDGDLFRVLER